MLLLTGCPVMTDFEARQERDLWCSGKPLLHATPRCIEVWLTNETLFARIYLFHPMQLSASSYLSASDAYFRKCVSVEDTVRWSTSSRSVALSTNAVLSGQYGVSAIFLSCAAGNDRDIVTFRSTWYSKLAILTNSSCCGFSDVARSPFLACLTQEASNGRARAIPLTYSLELRQVITALLRFDLSDRCLHRQIRASQRFRKV